MSEDIWKMKGEQADGLMKLITEGSFPLLPQSVGRFNLIPGATVALERIDAIWRENHELALESVKIAGKLRLIEQRPKNEGWVY